MKGYSIVRGVNICWFWSACQLCVFVLGELIHPIRKALVDNMDSCVNDIFGGQLTAKGADSAKPFLDFFLDYLNNSDEVSLTKERVSMLDKIHEEACLVATAMPNGDKFRSAMEVVSELATMIFLCHGPDKDLAPNKYAFIKLARGGEGRSAEEVRDAIQYLATMTKTACDKALEIASLHQSLIASSKEILSTIQNLFIQKFEDSMMLDAAIPAEVDSLTSVKDITEEFLNKHFDMNLSAKVSDKSIAMNTALRDVRVACSHMGITVPDFIDPQKFTQYEINNRDGLAFLCLVTVSVSVFF